MSPKENIRTKDTHLVWTDDEAQLLLETTRDFKAKKAYAQVDTESIKDKYENIRQTLCGKVLKLLRIHH